ncbi:hypothetical protein [Halostella salina]|uniref:hypothetical protein n=1 Tax=Halostella salina TaxID=1547897 RepID=UPI000EF84AF8|nr:hypothetical protein [Halostella salina]
MDRLRTHPAFALVGLGVLAALSGIMLGGDVFFGYGKFGEAYVFHVGVFAFALAGAMTLVRRTSLQASYRAVATASLALVALYLCAVVLLWYDVIVTPPPIYSPDPTLAGLALDRVSMALALTPLAAGYVFGADSVTSPGSRGETVPSVLVLFVLGSFALAARIDSSGGAHPGFVGLIYQIVLVVGVVAALPFYVVASWEFAERSDGASAT